jgi:hypothetical protein
MEHRLQAAGLDNRTFRLMLFNHRQHKLAEQATAYGPALSSASRWVKML